MLYILSAICFVYTVYKVACWLMDWLDSKAETEVKPAEPTFTPEEILQTKVILTQIELEAKALEARRKLYDEALKETKQ